MGQPSKAAVTPGNRLLAALPSDEFARLQPHLTPVQLQKEQILVHAGEAPRHAYFPLDGIISLLMLLEDGTTIEVANIGHEGLVDSTSILNIHQSPFEIMAQGPAQALRLTVKALRQEFRDGPGLRDLLLRYCGVMLTCTGRSLACNVVHTTEQRLAKWLLLARDRTAGDELPYTHEFLSQMLGVRRATVSLAAEAFKEQGLIDYHRGQVRILDRARLQEAACEDYLAFVEEYERLLGPMPAYGQLTPPNSVSTAD